MQGNFALGQTWKWDWFEKLWLVSVKSSIIRFRKHANMALLFTRLTAYFSPRHGILDSNGKFDKWKHTKIEQRGAEDHHNSQAEAIRHPLIPRRIFPRHTCCLSHCRASLKTYRKHLTLTILGWYRSPTTSRGFGSDLCCTASAASGTTVETLLSFHREILTGHVFPHHVGNSGV